MTDQKRLVGPARNAYVPHDHRIGVLFATDIADHLAGIGGEKVAVVFGVGLDILPVTVSILGKRLKVDIDVVTV